MIVSSSSTVAGSELASSAAPSGAAAVFSFSCKYSQLSSIPSSPEKRNRSASPCRRLFPELLIGPSFKPIASPLNVNGQGTLFGSSAGVTRQNPVASHLDTAATPAISASASNNIASVHISSNGCSNSLAHAASHQNNSAFGFLNRRRSIAAASSGILEDLGFLNSNGSAINNSVPPISSQNNGSAPNQGCILESPIMKRPLVNNVINSNNTNTLTSEQSFSALNTDCVLENNADLLTYQDMLTSSDPVVVFSHPSSSMDLRSSPAKNKHRSLKPAKFVNQLFGSTSTSANARPVSTPLTTRLLQMKPCSVKKISSSAAHSTTLLPASVRRRASSPTLISRPGPTLLPSESGIIHQLPCVDSPKDAIKRVSPSTLVDLLDGKFTHLYDQLLVFDCRYPYEFAGGHIPGALNVNTPDQANALMFPETQGPTGQHTIVVLHCEFSSERAPRMALHIRNLDRQLNKASYPTLCYPELYILEGGYKAFWSEFGVRCEPLHAYRPMRNPLFKEELREHQRARHAFKSACHLSQHSHALNKTAPSKRSGPTASSASSTNARQFFQSILDRSGAGSHADQGRAAFPRAVTPSASAFFPTHTIPQARSLSSILPSELDFPSEMDIDSFTET